jgi:A/G-specific adenine glycosylase
VGAVDTNVRRVLGRAAGGWDGLRPKELQAVADDLVPIGRAGEWTHALMDIGARFCRPRSPTCSECPARPWCAAAAASGVMAVDEAVEGVGAPQRARRSGAAARTRRRAGTAIPFRETARWLRGRLIDMARAAQGDEWVPFDEPIESHDGPTVAAAVRALAAEGLLEVHSTDATLARLPR